MGKLIQPGVTLYVYLSPAVPASATPAYVDITNYVIDMSVKPSSRSTELDAFVGGTLTVKLNNSDRRFDPTYSGSPYYPNLLPMRRIQVVVVDANAATPGTKYLFTGYIHSWPQDYDMGNTYSEVTINADDAFIVLTKGMLPSDTYTVDVMASAPYLYYRLSESQGTVAADSSGNGRNAVYTGGATFNSRASLLPYSSDTAIGFDGIDDSVTIPIGYAPTAYPFTVEFWMETTTTTASVLWEMSKATDVNSRFAILIDAVGSLTATAIPTNVTNFRNTFSTGGWNDGDAHHVVCVFNSATAIPSIYIDGVDAAFTSSSVGTATFGTGYTTHTIARSYDNTGYFTATVDDFALYQGLQMSLATAAAHYSSGANAFANERTDQRVTRVLDAISWPTGSRTLSTGDSRVQAASYNGDAGSYLKSLEATERGQLYVDGAGNVVFRNRHYRWTNTTSLTSQATFGDGTGEIPYVKIRLVPGDNTQLRNDISVQRANGTTQRVTDAASIAKYYTYGASFSGMLYQTDEESYGLANYLLALYKEPGTRISEMVVNAAASTTVMRQVLNLQIGQRITVKRWPQRVGTAITKVLIIEGISHSIDVQGNWLTTFTLSPAEVILQAFTTNHATYGVTNTNNYTVF